MSNGLLQAEMIFPIIDKNDNNVLCVNETERRKKIFLSNFLSLAIKIVIYHRRNFSVQLRSI